MSKRSGHNGSETQYDIYKIIFILRAFINRWSVFDYDASEQKIIVYSK
jgi:hypothetical protein